MKDEGKHPEDREEFTRVVMKGRISGVIAWRRDEGIGSRAQVVGRWERRSWETSVSVRGENEGRQGVREAQRGGTERGAGRGVEGGEGAPDVCNLLIEERSEVISSDGGLRWWGRNAEERRENRKQLLWVRQ